MAFSTPETKLCTLKLSKTMYLKPFKNFTYSVVFQNRAGSPPWRKQRWSPLNAAFVTWTFRLPPVFFWTFSFHLEILHVFFASLKLQYCRTIVLLNKLKLFKETSFSKATMVLRFPAKKNAVAQKHRAISRQEKMAFSTPGRVALGLPSPSPRVCTDVRWSHNQNFSDR